MKKTKAKKIPALLRDSLKTAAVYSVISGIAIVLIWIIFGLTGLVPGLESNGTASVVFLLLAEGLTAAGLIASGILILRGSAGPWAGRLLPVSLGMLLYAVIYATGVFFGKGPVFWGWFFLVITAATALVLAGIILRTKDR